jgi:hypothetical protein
MVDFLSVVFHHAGHLAISYSSKVAGKIYYLPAHFIFIISFYRFIPVGSSVYSKDPTSPSF